MVVAYHLILTGYGHWLPNDPRGSMSHRVWSKKLRGAGTIHYGRKEQQTSREELHAFYQRAEQELAQPVLWFDAAKRQAIAEAFEEVVAANRYTCFACDISTNHAHVVIRKHRHKAEQMIEALKCESIKIVRSLKDCPDDHPVWSDNPRKRFISTLDHLREAIRYISEHHAKSNLRMQSYRFVTPYNGEWFGDQRRRHDHRVDP